MVIPVNIDGPILGLSGAFWAEALSINLEERNGLLWLLIRPDIWVSPLSMREQAANFLRAKKIRRYNSQSYQLLNAWIKILFGSEEDGGEASISCFPDTDFRPIFKINTRTAYSLGGV